MKKKVAIILGVLALVAGIGGVVTAVKNKGVLNTNTTNQDNQTGEVTEEQVEPVEWIEYSLPEFSVSYPSNWIVRDDRSTKYLTVEAPLLGRDDVFKENYMVAYIGSESDLGSTERYINDTLLPGIKKDSSVIQVGEPEKVVLTTNDTVNKIYDDSYRIAVKCKISDYDKSTLSDTKYENGMPVQDRVDVDPALTGTPVFTTPEETTNATTEESSNTIMSEGATLPDKSEASDNMVQTDKETVEVEDLNADIKDTAGAPDNTATSPDTPADNTAASSDTDNLEERVDGEETQYIDPYEDKTITRVYLIINNGGEIYAFISCTETTETDKYDAVYETALQSFNAKFGSSKSLDIEKEKARTVVEGIGQAASEIQEEQKAAAEESETTTKQSTPETTTPQEKTEGAE